VRDNVMLIAIHPAKMCGTLTDHKLEQQHAPCCLPSHETVQVKSDLKCQIE